jgi:prepilin-type N-terminal cleavage/methylation domain-containing protein
MNRCEHSQRSRPEALAIGPARWSAFTLIELLVVIAIIAILAALPGPVPRESGELHLELPAMGPGGEPLRQ